MIDDGILMEILKSREDRAKKQKELIKKYKMSLISFTLNIPGQEKDNSLYRKIHKKGLEEILKEANKRNLGIIHKEEIDKSTGREAYLLMDLDSTELKRVTIGIEEKHPLGRIFDIDVFDSVGHQITRRKVGAEPRKCLLCNKEVRICMREKNHTYEDLISAIKDLGESYI